MGFCGKNYSLLNSTWNSEYFEGLDSQNKDAIPQLGNTNLATLFNYEVSSNETNNKYNIVSKHCIINEKMSPAKNESFLTKRYYYHLNK